VHLWAAVLFWWLAFAGSHMFLSSLRVRGRIVAGIGERAFAGLYSVVALVTFVPIVWTYWGARHSGPMLWNLRGLAAVRLLAIVLAAIGFALVSASFVQPSAAGMDPRAVPRAQGILRITRHPLLMGLGLWGMAHTLVNGFLADVVFFGGFPLFALFGAAHQDARKQADRGQRLGPFFDETSLLPFVAIATGRNRVEAGELPWGALGAGTLVALILYLLHPALFA
jgi:uncharacterized membrane protein